MRIDADQRRAVAVLRHRHDGRAGHGAGQEQMHNHHQRKRGTDDQQTLHRRGNAGQVDDAGVRRLHALEIGAPYRLRRGFQKQQHTDGGNHRMQRGSMS